VMVLEEPNSRNWFTINIEQIKPFNTATPTRHNSSSNNGHYKVEEVLKERTAGISTRSSGLVTLTATTAGSQFAFFPSLWVAFSYLQKTHFLFGVRLAKLFSFLTTKLL